MKFNEYISNLKRIMKLINKMCPSYLLLTLFEQGIIKGRPLLSMFLGAKIIDGIMSGREEREILSLALFLVISNMVLALLQWGIDKLLIIKRREVEFKIDTEVACKSLSMDYQIMENAEMQERLTKVREGTQYGGGISQFCDNIADMISALIGILYSACAFVPLFLTNFEWDKSGITGFVNSWCGSVLYILILIAVVVYDYRIWNKISEQQNRNFEYAIHFNRIVSYLWGYIYDYQSGKGVRIYDMHGLVKNVMEMSREKTTSYWFQTYRKLSVHFGKWNFCWAFILGVSYFFVGMKVYGGAVSIGEFTFYTEVAATLVQSLFTLLNLYAFVQMTTRYLINFADYLEVPNEKYEGTLPIEKRLDNDYELEFRNVSFHYPNSSEMVLKNITAKIHVGRKMAIVGKNGSGKSTFVKLLCRLYDPTEGEILLNGIDIKKYDYDEYRLIFGVVFQDFQLFSFPVAQNVAAGTHYDEKKVWKVLDEVGMAKKVKAMDKGMETVIYKQENEGVEISGGEAQKLAIARALYKDAPVMILDEPTAALDPISELEIYERFDEMVKEKTAIYISHRMSSCRFCENILVFEDGNIAQTGSHEHLVEQDGLYAELWKAQAQYYQEN